jgi:hypothetical protein
MGRLCGLIFVAVSVITCAAGEVEKDWGAGSHYGSSNDHRSIGAGEWEVTNGQPTSAENVSNVHTKQRRKGVVLSASIAIAWDN